MLICLGIALLNIVYAFITDMGIYMMVMSVVLFLAAAVFYVTRAMHLFKWKESVGLYIDSVMESGHARIELGETAFTFIRDGEKMIEKWDAIKAVGLQDDYIEFHGSTHYLF